jgi:YD repeat-containing protein
MDIVYVLIGSGILVLIFLILWLKERRQSRMEYIAYGLRSSEDNTENSRTNVTVMNDGFSEAMSRLEDMGEVSQDEWGHWIWTESGKPVGKTVDK